MANSTSIYKKLTASLNFDARRAVTRRYEWMQRDLKYFAEKDDKNFTYLRRRRWTNEKFLVLFQLNCVYQEVLGPQDVVSRPKAKVLGNHVPVRYGALSFDAAYSFEVKTAVSNFFTLTADLGFDSKLLSLQSCKDILYWAARIARDERRGNKSSIGENDS